MRHVVMAMLIALSCFDLSLAQAATPEERESLRGLPGVLLVTEKIAQDAQADGLSQEAIRTAAELVLRSNGIRVITDEQSIAMHSVPMLEVNIGTIKESSLSFYSCAINVYLSQRVSLPHSSQKQIWAITWKQQSFGYIGESRLSEVTTQVETQIKKFADDFLAVNPR